MSVMLQAKKTGLLGDGLNDLSDDRLSDLSDDESTDDNPPKKRGRRITGAYALDKVTAPVLSMHKTPHVAKSTYGGRYTQKRSKVSLIAHPLSETALTQKVNHKGWGTSVEAGMPTTMDESKASISELRLMTDHPTTEEELSIVESDHHPIPKKNTNRYSNVDIRASIKARCVIQGQRKCTNEVC
jgi:hypothetical protein